MGAASAAGGGAGSGSGSRRRCRRCGAKAGRCGSQGGAFAALPADSVPRWNLLGSGFSFGFAELAS